MSSLPAFTPGGVTATLAVTSSSGNVPITRNGANQLLILNSGSNMAFVDFGTSAKTATVTDTPIPAGGWVLLTIPPDATHLAAITGSSTTTLYATPGDGEFQGAGGGSGGGSGGNVVITDPVDGFDHVQVTIYDSAGNALTYNANGQATMANSTPVVIASNQSAVPVAVADGSDVAEGARADTAWTSGSGSVISILKAIVGAVVSATGTLAAGPPSAAIRTVNALASAGAQTIVASSASDGTILAANAGRIAFSVTNDSASATLYLLLATGTSSATVYTVQVPPGGFFSNDSYAGVVKGIWSAAVGNARVTENT